MSNDLRSWLYLVFLSAIWGSSFILMKKAMYTTDGQEIFSHMQVAALRMTIAAGVLVPFALRALRKIKSWRDLALLSLVGLCGNFLPAFLFTYSETGISSGYAGMLNSFTPIFAILIGFVVFRERLTMRKMIGIGIGSVGVVLLMLAGHNLSVSGSWWHILAIVVATLCYAISLNTIKYTLQHFKSFEITSLSFLIIFLPSVFIAWSQDTVATMTTNEFAMDGLFYLLILSVVGTAFAVIMFNKLITISSIVFASSVTYLIPVFAVIIGLYFEETINDFQVVSMLVVLAGVFVANYPARRAKPKMAT